MVKGFVVVLDKDYHAEAAREIQAAIAMVRGVQNVEVSECTPGDWMNRERIRREYGEAILDILRKSA